MRRAVSIAPLAIGLLVLGSSIAVAANEFTDVPNDHVFHNDIAWLADQGVTKGCNPPTNDQFCPSDPVTRAQMAAFLHRFGNITVPTTIVIDQFGFSPVRSNHTYLDYDYSGIAPIGRYGNDLMGASAPVPDGAVITGFSATFCDSNLAVDLRAELIRRPDPSMSSGYSETMAEVVTSGDTCAVTVSTTSIAEPVVDASSYSYAILVSNATSGTSVNIRRATVTYEMPLVP